MSRWSNMWGAALGKVSSSGMFSWKGLSRIWVSDPTVDYSRNDYDLSRSIYYGSVINGKGKDMLLGSAFAKPIVNTSAAFAIGVGFNVKLHIKDEDTTEKDKDATEEVNDWIQSKMAEITNYVIHGMRDGDSYLYIDELCELDEFDANNVEIILDPITGEVIGFDVTEIVEERLPNQNRTTKWKIVKKFRKDSVRFEKYDEHDKFVEVIFEQVYTVDGTVTPTENQQFYEGELLERQLPVIHYANDKEPRAIYGNSEFQNLYVYFKQYHNILDHASMNVVYNSAPVAVVSGVTKPNVAAQQSGSEDNEGVSWEPNTVMYLNGEKADAKFIQATGVIADAKDLLKTLFNLIIEASETPEFVFGTAVQSSKASTETQMPVLIQKAERKRVQLEGVVTQLIKAYIDRQISLGNTSFLRYRNQEVKVEVSFPDLGSEDKTLTLELVTFAHEAGLLTDDTALSLLLSDKIDNIQEELEKARREGQESAANRNVLPEETTRLEDELASGEPTPTDTPPSPEEE